MATAIRMCAPAAHNGQRRFVYQAVWANIPKRLISRDIVTPCGCSVCPQHRGRPKPSSFQPTSPQAASPRMSATPVNCHILPVRDIGG